MFELINKKVISLLIQIETGKIKPTESGIGIWLNKLKDIDEPTYDTLLARYKKALNTLKTNR